MWSIQDTLDCRNWPTQGDSYHPAGVSCQDPRSTQSTLRAKEIMKKHKKKNMYSLHSKPWSHQIQSPRHSAFLAAAFFFASACVKQKRVENFRGKSWWFSGVHCNLMRISWDSWVLYGNLNGEHHNWWTNDNNGHGMYCTRLESNLAANSRVLIGTSSINHGFSSMPCLMTGGYPLKARIFHSTLSRKPEGKS